MTIHIAPVALFIFGLGMYTSGLMAEKDEIGRIGKWVLIVIGIAAIVIWTHIVGVDR